MTDPIDVHPILIILLGIVGWITLVILFNFAAKDTPSYALFLTFISWFMCFSTYVVFPIDLYMVTPILKNLDHK